MNNKPLFEDSEDTIKLPVVEEKKEEERPRPRISPETRVIPKDEPIVEEKKDDSTLSDVIDEIDLDETEKVLEEESKIEHIQEVKKTEEEKEEKLIEITEEKKDEQEQNSMVRLIATIALFIIIGFFFLRTVYAFYVGFKYYDTRGQVTETNKK